VADPRFLLDSNICIYLLKGSSNVVRQHVESRSPGELVTSAITFAEVMMGVNSAEQMVRAIKLFTLVAVLPFDRLAAESYVKLPFKRGSYDRLIGAHALSLGLTLVTANERHFKDIPGLNVENWAV